MGAEGWTVVCEGRTVHGGPLYGQAGGAAHGVAPGVHFTRVACLACRIDAGVMAPLTLRLDKPGGEPFCPLTGQPGDGPCVAVFGPGETADFAYEAVP